MKKIVSISLILTTVLCLCACGNSQPSEQKTTPTEAQSEKVTEPATEEALAKGNVIDSGLFKALCPEGWTNIPREAILVKDFGDKVLEFSDGKSGYLESDIHHTLSLVYENDRSIDDGMSMYITLMGNLYAESSVEIGQTTYRSLSYNNGATESIVVFIPEGQGYVELTFPLIFEGVEVHAIDEPDILAIIESIEID